MQMSLLWFVSLYQFCTLMPPALLSESGHFSPRLGRHKQRLLMLFYVSGTCFPWQKLLILCGGGWQSSGSGMVWEANIRTCTFFFILCCLESYSRLQAVSILWLFSGWMWWHRIAWSVLSKCPSTFCVYAWQTAFTFSVNLTNRRSVWAAIRGMNYRKWGWMGLRQPSIFLFPTSCKTS